jgi:hypothetical protein
LIATVAVRSVLCTQNNILKRCDTMARYRHLKIEIVLKSKVTELEKEMISDAIGSLVKELDDYVEVSKFEENWLVE